MDIINILIVSYNDNDINNTIQSLIVNSSNLVEFKFKILFVETVNIDDVYFNDSRFEILYITKNKGVGYNRKVITSNLPKNEYVLQLDSHHRFIKNWDIDLIENYKSLKCIYDKIIISTGMPPFKENMEYPTIFTQTKVGRYSSNGIPIMSTMVGNPNVESGLISAHFIFTETNTFNLLKYSELWYFFGEEILLSLQSYKNEIKIFTPNKIIGWHKYKSIGDDILNDFSIERKTYKRILKKIKELYNINFTKLINIDVNSFKCSPRNYNVHGADKYDTIVLLKVDNSKIIIKNENYHNIVRYHTDTFLKGAIMINTQTNTSKYFSFL
jgi:hypothetical protein